MKFRIKFADQIVMVSIIFAMAAIIFVIFMLGGKQRWFVKDLTYKTYFSSASGLAQNMAITYKGFTVGAVKSFSLTEDDEVAVIFSIRKEYAARVREGSLVDLNVSPIGLGNQFLFYPGLGAEELAEGAYIPTVSSPQGQTFVSMNLSSVPAKNDSISNILSQVEGITKTLNGTLTDVQSALVGTDLTTLGRSLSSVETTLAGVTVLPTTINSTVTQVNELLAGLQGQLQPIIADVNALTTKLNEPDGLVYTALDTQGPVYSDLVKALDSVTGILNNLDNTTELLPGQVPGLLTDVRVALKNVNDLLIALENNPLLKKGVPTQVQTLSSGTNPRNVDF